MTKIKFQLPNKGFVNLKVFDMLGKEVGILVNGDLSAGTYEYEWNAVNLPSGIYFYRFTTGNYTETKKMILVK